MADFWYIVLMTSLAYLTLVLPIGLWYSELDDEDLKIVSLQYVIIFLQGQKVFTVVKKEFVVIVLVSLFLFPTYAFMSYAEIPVTAQTCIAANNVFIPSEQAVTDSDFTCNTMTHTL